MPTDLTAMTTLDLLRELEARGGMPAKFGIEPGGLWLWYDKDCVVHREFQVAKFRWVEPYASVFAVALEAHLSGMGVATEMLPDCDGHPLWCCRPVLRSGAVEGSTVSYRVDKAPVFGPGVDGLLRAAVGALREVQGG